MKRRIVLIEWEDREIGDPAAPDGCFDHDVDEALEHLRVKHGCAVLEDQPGGLFEKAFVSVRKLDVIARVLSEAT